MKYESEIALRYWKARKAMEWVDVYRYWPTAKVEMESFGKLLMTNPEYRGGILQLYTIDSPHGYSMESVLSLIRDLCITSGNTKILEAAENDVELWRNTTHPYINMYDIIHLGNCWGYKRVAEEWHAHIGPPETEIHLADFAKTFLDNVPPGAYEARHRLADCIYIIIRVLGKFAKKKYLRDKEKDAGRTACEKSHLRKDKAWDDQTYHYWELILRDNLINWVHEALNVEE